MSMLSSSGIYVITNLVNGKRYYGSAAKFSTRFSVHKYYLNKGTSRSTKLQNAWNKYGESSFEFTPMFVCAKSDLLMYEQRVLDAFDAVNTGYNICSTAGSALGVKRRPESIAKTRAAHIGRKYPEDVRKRMGAANLGKKLSEDHVAKVVARTKGLKRDDEFRRKLSERSKGKRHSDETKEKQRQAALNRDSARGEKNVNAKMNPDRVRHIRDLHSKGVALTEIGREVGLHPSTVADIAYRKTWRHVV
jgi:group I intron endonuclease